MWLGFHRAGTVGAFAAGRIRRAVIRTGCWLPRSSTPATRPFLHLGRSQRLQWLIDSQFLDVVATGLSIPGPVVITGTFVGYLAAGWLGALVANVAILTPIFLGVVLPARCFIRHRDKPQIKAFVAGAAAIAVVCLGLLLRWKVKQPILVGLGAAVGPLLHWR